MRVSLANYADFFKYLQLCSEDVRGKRAESVADQRNEYIEIQITWNKNIYVSHNCGGRNQSSIFC